MATSYISSGSGSGKLLFLPSGTGDLLFLPSAAGTTRKIAFVLVLCLELGT
jgi:hypothetical protein